MQKYCFVVFGEMDILAGLLAKLSERYEIAASQYRDTDVWTWDSYCAMQDTVLDSHSPRRGHWAVTLNTGQSPSDMWTLDTGQSPSDVWTVHVIQHVQQYEGAWLNLKHQRGTVYSPQETTRQVSTSTIDIGTTKSMFILK